MTVFDFLSSVASWVFQATFKASILAVIIFLIQAALRRRLSARWHYALWFILIIRLAIPFNIESNLSLFNLLPFHSQSVLASKSQTAETIRIHFPEVSYRYPDSFIQNVIPASNIPQRFELLQEDVKSRPSVPDGNSILSSQIVRQSFELSTENMVIIIWITGVIFFSVYSGVGNFRLWKRMRKRREVTSPEVLNLFARCKKKMNISSSIKLVEIEDLKIPVLYGFLNPRILLPVNINESLSLNELRYIFFHELTHHRRRDVLLAWISSILQLFHWFNPVIWYAFLRIRSDRELACDESILSSIGADKSRTYGRTIISLLEQISVKKYFPVTVGILESKKDLKRRLMMISRFKKKSVAWSIFAFILLISLGSLSLTEAQSSSELSEKIFECTQSQYSLEPQSANEPVCSSSNSQ